MLAPDNPPALATMSCEALWSPWSSSLTFPPPTYSNPPSGHSAGLRESLVGISSGEGLGGA